MCFPHAGAGASAFADWVGLLPPEVELVAVQLPGRQNRIAEEPFSETGPLVNALVHALGPEFDGPYSFFGHSAGAALAYELTWALKGRGRPGPDHLFLSAQPAPGATAIRWLHELPDADFSAEIMALGGMDPELASDRDAVASLLPLLRADFGLWERHHVVPRQPLDCPITVFCGESDPRAPLASLEGWRALTAVECDVRIFPGGHFYFLDHIPDLVSLMVERMLAVTSGRRQS